MPTIGLMVAVPENGHESHRFFVVDQAGNNACLLL